MTDSNRTDTGVGEMIERVALAMAQCLLPYQADASVGDLEGTTLTYVDVGPLDMAELARAAIEALKPEFERCYAAGLSHGSADAEFVLTALQDTSSRT